MLVLAGRLVIYTTKRQQLSQQRQGPPQLYNICPTESICIYYISLDYQFRCCFGDFYVVITMKKHC